MKRMLLVLFLMSMVGVTAVFMFQSLSAGGLAVIAAQPAPRSLSAPVDTAVTIQFSQPISRSTIGLAPGAEAAICVVTTVPQ